jgi:hypothetical protein
MKDISHILEEERLHYVKCRTCGNYFDCRNLSEVLDHTYENNRLNSDFTFSRRLPEPVEYLKGKIKIPQN